MSVKLAGTENRLLDAERRVEALATLQSHRWMEFSKMADNMKELSHNMLTQSKSNTRKAAIRADLDEELDLWWNHWCDVIGILDLTSCRSYVIRILDLTSLLFNFLNVWIFYFYFGIAHIYNVKCQQLLDVGDFLLFVLGIRLFVTLFWICQRNLATCVDSTMKNWKGSKVISIRVTHSLYFTSAL